MSARTADQVYADVVVAVLAGLRARRGFDGWWDNVDAEIQAEIVLALEVRVKGAVGTVVEAAAYAAEVDRRLSEGNADTDDLIRACARCAKALEGSNDAR